MSEVIKTDPDENGWFSCEDIMPTGIVECYLENGARGIAFYSVVYDHWDFGAEQKPRVCKNPVTHWKPLTPPPIK